MTYKAGNSHSQGEKEPGIRVSSFGTYEGALHHIRNIGKQKIPFPGRTAEQRAGYTYHRPLCPHITHCREAIFPIRTYSFPAAAIHRTVNRQIPDKPFHYSGFEQPAFTFIHIPATLHHSPP